jgi:hypothetical protein
LATARQVTPSRSAPISFALASDSTGRTVFFSEGLPATLVAVCFGRSFPCRRRSVWRGVRYLFGEISARALTCFSGATSLYFFHPILAYVRVHHMCVQQTSSTSGSFLVSKRELRFLDHFPFEAKCPPFFFLTPLCVSISMTAGMLPFFRDVAGLLDPVP